MKKALVTLGLLILAALTYAQASIIPGGGGGGSTSPGGSTTQCQWNNAGSFAGTSGCTVAANVVTLTAPEITSLADDTTGNALTTAHGFLKKLDNTATHYMDGTGNWSTPAGGSGNVAQSTSWMISEEFLAIPNPSGAGGDIVAFKGGTGSTFTTGNPDINHPGIQNCKPGTTSTTTCGYGMSSSATNVDGKSLLLGGGVFDSFSDFRLTTLSDGTNTYHMYSGFLDTCAAAPANGVYVRYNNAVNGGRWEFVTVAASTETATDTTVAVASATWYKVEITCNAGATSCTATINGTPTTNTTHIPNSATNFVSFGTCMRWTVATAQTFDEDYMSVSQTLTTPR